MAEQEVQPAEAGDGGNKKKVVMLLILVGGLVLGGGGGLLVVAPMFGAATPAATADDNGSGGQPAPRPVRRDPPMLYATDNLVLNPAGSGGTRFLMASAAFEVRDGRVVDQMRNHELALKDTLLQLLGSKTVEELADITKRDALKVEIAEAVEALFGPGSVIDVYLPQFVIQ